MILFKLHISYDNKSIFYYQRNSGVGNLINGCDKNHSNHGEIGSERNNWSGRYEREISEIKFDSWLTCCRVPVEEKRWIRVAHLVYSRVLAARREFSTAAERPAADWIQSQRSFAASGASRSSPHSLHRVHQPQICWLFFTALSSDFGGYTKAAMTLSGPRFA